MIQLTVYPAAFGEPSASPFCMKAICMLKAAGLPFETLETGDPRKTPKGKLPVIRAKGEVIADSEQVRAHIEASAEFDFDAGLSDYDRAVSRAVIRMVEEHLYFAIVADRWGEDDNWRHVRAAFFSDIPWLIRGLVTRFVRKQAMQQLHGQGIGRHTREERFDRVRRDIVALKGVLGGRQFLFGDRPSAADYSVVPMLRAALVTPVQKPLGNFISNDPVLMAYVDRVMAQCYP